MKLDLHNSPEKNLTPQRVQELINEVNEEWANTPEPYAQSGKTVTEIIVLPELKTQIEKSKLIKNIIISTPTDLQ